MIDKIKRPELKMKRTKKFGSPIYLIGDLIQKQNWNLLVKLAYKICKPSTKMKR